MEGRRGQVKHQVVADPAHVEWAGGEVISPSPS